MVIFPAVLADNRLVVPGLLAAAAEIKKMPVTFHGLSDTSNR
jgi:hypothetical protein